MTRYFLTLQEAISLLFKASEVSHGGETFVMKMPACKISDLADVMIEELSPNEKVPIEEIGVRPGEKIHEVLVSRYEAPLSYQYDENYFLILPQLHIDHLAEKHKNLKKVGFEEYTSNDVLMTKEDIRKMLKDGKFI